MMHPSYELPREYAVRIRGRLAPADMERLKQGVRLEDGAVRVEMIEDEGGEGANRWYRIVLREGRNRVVRRLFESLGLTVSRLMRIRFGPVSLPPRLTRGRFLELESDEVRELLGAVRLVPVDPPSHRERGPLPGKQQAKRPKPRHRY
jgi:23S rRNA pseudouridine2605 synthase